MLTSASKAEDPEGLGPGSDQDFEVDCDVVAIHMAIAPSRHPIAPMGLRPEARRWGEERVPTPGIYIQKMIYPNELATGGAG